MKHERGFALLDTIAGSLILFIGIMSICNLTVSARQALNYSHWKSNADNVVQSEIENIRALGALQAINLGLVDLGSPVVLERGNGLTVSIQSEWMSGSNRLLHVRVEGAWRTGGRNGNVVVATYVL